MKTDHIESSVSPACTPASLYPHYSVTSPASKVPKSSKKLFRNISRVREVGKKEKEYYNKEFTSDIKFGYNYYFI
jgi:hypothetical protein